MKIQDIECYEFTGREQSHRSVSISYLMQDQKPMRTESLKECPTMQSSSGILLGVMTSCCSLPRPWNEAKLLYGSGHYVGSS